MWKPASLGVAMSGPTKEPAWREGEVVVKGWMKLGPDYDQGTWRGWRVHADPSDDRFAVTIVKGHTKRVGP